MSAWGTEAVQGLDRLRLCRRRPSIGRLLWRGAQHRPRAALCEEGPPRVDVLAQKPCWLRWLAVRPLQQTVLTNCTRLTGCARRRQAVPQEGQLMSTAHKLMHRMTLLAVRRPPGTHAQHICSIRRGEPVAGEHAICPADKHMLHGQVLPTWWVVSCSLEQVVPKA